MTKARRRNDLGERGGGARLAAERRHTRAGDRVGHAGTGQEPGLELRELPGASQQRQQVRGAPHEAIALPLALTHLDDQALGVDVGALALTECGDPYARGRAGGEERAMLEVAWGQQSRLDLLAREDDGERLGLFGRGDKVPHPRTAQGGLGETTQGTDGLEKDALRGLLVEEMEVGGTDMLGVETIGRGVEMLGALGDVAQIPVDGVGRVVANGHVFAHTLT